MSIELEKIMLTVKIGNKNVEILAGDITKVKVDVIVNAANSGLMGGGGVDGAIHRHGGPEILAACKEYRAVNPPLPTGEAIITCAGELPAKSVIHTVGPVWNGGKSGEAQLLASAYRKSLYLADENGFSSIAFPAISTGIYGYPLELATGIVKEILVSTLSRLNNILLVKLVLFSEGDFKVYNSVFDPL